MKFVRMSHPRTAVLSVTDSAPKSQNRNAGMFLVVSARLLMRKNARLFMLKSVTLLPDKSVKRFTTLRFVVTSGPRSASRCPRRSVSKCPRRNALMSRRGNARQWKKKSVFIDPIHRDQGSERPSVHYSSKECLSAHFQAMIPSIQTKEVSDRQCTTAQRNVCQPISKQ